MKTLRFLSLVAIAAMTTIACTKHDSPWRHDGGGGSHSGQGQGQGQGQGGQGTGEKDFQLKEMGWRILYAGREELDGAKVEVIDVEGIPSGTSYLVSVINRANYETYKGDVKAFFRNELKYAGDNIYSGNSQRVLFDPFRHGTWYAFVIGLNKDLELSGEYAYLKFNVEEEQPTADYLKWIGKWTVTSGHISYTLNITQEEANFMYRVDGWETGGSVNTVMDLEYLETFYDNGRMFFTSQYITTYNDEDLKVDVDECFLGQVDYDGIHQEQGLYLIPDEGLDLAEAFFETDRSAVLRPCRVRANIGGEMFEAPFYNMQYFFTDGKTWYHYNDNVPPFPLTMTYAGEADLMPRRLRSGVFTRADSADDSALRRGKPFVAKSARPVPTAVKL